MVSPTIIIAIDGPYYHQENSFNKLDAEATKLKEFTVARY
jgi:hypothetical protein